MERMKFAESMGSGLPDTTKTDAASKPTATDTTPVVVGNTPAPGQTGPRGMAPRTSYSRVNTGSTPSVGLGSEGNSSPPRGLEFLPAKVAFQESDRMATIQGRPTLQDLVKSAMEGASSRVHIAEAASEALRMRATPTPVSTKVAANTVPGEVIEKTAAALEWLAKQGEGNGPGAELPPGALVTESSEPGFDVNQLGEATSQNQPPMNPPMASLPGSPNPANAMATNIDMEHGEQPVDPMGNGKASNEAQKTSSLRMKNLAVMGKLAGVVIPTEGVTTSASSKPASTALATVAKPTSAPGAAAKAAPGRLSSAAAATKNFVKAHPKTIGAGVGGAALGTGLYLGAKALHGAFHGSDKKTASLLRRNYAALGLGKHAAGDEDEANISAGPASAQGAQVPDGASASGEGPIPNVPSEMSSQEALVDSADKAINLTRRQAKAEPKSEMGRLLSEPALSAATDKTLAEAFDNTNNAGAKIASRLVKTAAARALLAKLAEQSGVAKKPKTKTSEMDLSTPSAQSGFNAGTAGA